MKNLKIVKKFMTILLIAGFLMLIAATPNSLASSPMPRKGTAIINGSELTPILGTPESNLRFALWNGTTWFELPYSVEEEVITKTSVFDANGTTTTSAVSETWDTVTKKDVISIKIPAIAGINTSSAQWWDFALHLNLQERLLITLSDRTGYSTVIYAYPKDRLMFCSRLQLRLHI